MSPRQWACDPPISTPTSRLTKLGPNDDAGHNVPDNVSSVLDRVLIDNTICELSPDAWRTLAANHRDTVYELVRQLENWQVA
ncbi:unnamed protein product [Lota lota]